MSDELKRAEINGYQRGYAAGKRRKARTISEEERQRRADALWLRVFVASIPAALTLTNWVRGEKPILNIGDRVEHIAAAAADEAVKAARRRVVI